MSFLGRLSFDALPHDPIMLGGALSMVLIGATLVGLLTYFKKWKWLWKEWLTSLDPKKIGIMYLIVAAVMLLRGLADAGMMRAQQVLSVGDSQGILSSDHFQQVFSAHGSIMIFFVAMGFMFGLINLILPLQLGARDVAFPFMNSVSFWLFVAGMMLMNVSLVIGEFSAAGWLAYPPLSGLEYSPGVGVDYWIWSLQIAGIGSLLSGVNFFVTTLKMRAKGMTLMKMPIFAWSVLGSMALIMFAFPILTATLGMLSLDRLMGMHFFTSDFGGNAMMYVNLIWAWGHPEVYILVLPAFGIFSEVVATFSRKRLFGYTSMVWAILAITVLSFVVWLHHFFTMGAGANVNAFFGIMTMVIAIPTGVKVFNWLFTMYRGRIRLTTPMLWFLGFVLTFTIGGMTGVLMSVPAIDFQMHNSLFLVAHFHNMIIGGVLFGYFAGFAYWFPKIFGFKLNETLGKYAFWCWIVGFMLAFIPLYILGFMGATRRLDHYDASMGWQGLFIVSAVGVAVIIAGVGFQILQLLVSIFLRNRNRDVTGDPWDGRTLEWSTASPAPIYNFARIPSITDRDAFWAAKQAQANDSVPTAPYEDITLPKNSGYGVMIAGASFVFGFALIWHIWWLAITALLVAIILLIVRLSDDETEYTIPAAQVALIEAQRVHGGSAL
ncbi:MAG TPA: cytochrome o ubiquinol oxidase subunit I [Candidatus Saccharimonadales bacterium]|nr:cytochrome o ubiquinol oxidase subunit I [Candidatus Saccharimonadales bacterium]